MTRKGKGIARAPVKAIDQTLMNELFTYAETATAGMLFWKKSGSGRKIKAGFRAGCLGADKYWYVKVDNIQYSLHRVIWTMHFGPIPAGKQINHIDENKSNNRIDNLRLDTPADNINWGTGNARRAAALKGKKQSPQSIALRAKCKEIYCHETFTTYPSVKLAAAALSVHATDISMVLNNKRKHAKGLTFSYHVTTPVTS